MRRENSKLSATEETSDGYFRRFTNFFDDHLYEIRYVSVGLAVIGVVVTARSIYAFHQFRRVSEIPAHYITSHARLHGVVKSVGSRDTLMVEHTPLVKIKWSQNKTDTELLPVNFAGIDLTEPGVTWVKDTLLNKSVVFQLLQENKHNGVDSLVTAKKWLLFNQHINEEVVKRGLARVKDNIETAIPQSKVGDRYIKNIIAAEHHADRKGVGLWKRPSVMENIQQWPGKTKTSILQSFRNLGSKVINWMPWKKKRKQN